MVGKEVAVMAEVMDSYLEGDSQLWQAILRTAADTGDAPGLHYKHIHYSQVVGHSVPLSCTHCVRNRKILAKGQHYHSRIGAGVSGRS